MLEDDLKNTLDLIHRKYRLFPSDKEISIYIGDLKKYKLNPQDFAEAFSLMKDDLKLELTSGFDEESLMTYQKGSPEEEPTCFTLMLPNNFEALYKKSLKKIELQRNPSKINIVLLYLSKDGDLWREPRKTYSYPLGLSSKRYALLRAIINKPTGTKELEKLFSIKFVGKEISKIRDNINKFLGVPGKKYIPSRKKGMGYKTEYIEFK